MAMRGSDGNRCGRAGVFRCNLPDGFPFRLAEQSLLGSLRIGIGSLLIAVRLVIPGQPPEPADFISELVA
jgi:hypothetical protein